MNISSRKHNLTKFRHRRSPQHILAEGLSIEASEFVTFYGKADFDWFAAYLAVFNVGLTADG